LLAYGGPGYSRPRSTSGANLRCCSGWLHRAVGRPRSWRWLAAAWAAHRPPTRTVCFVRMPRLGGWCLSRRGQLAVENWRLAPTTFGPLSCSGAPVTIPAPRDLSGLRRGGTGPAARPSKRFTDPGRDQLGDLLQVVPAVAAGEGQVPLSLARAVHGRCRLRSLAVRLRRVGKEHSGCPVRQDRAHAAIPRCLRDPLTHVLPRLPSGHRMLPERGTARERPSGLSPVTPEGRSSATHSVRQM
jgi:hypothetical protein